jgi:TetR/AcrR family transcriptional regulator of autoinduction and epiphytic fitness
VGDRAAAVDGRHLRRQRSQDAVIEAILDLLSEGQAQPTAVLVSERSGVSMRSIFRLFDDMEALHRAAIARQSQRVTAMLVPLPSAGPLADRVAPIVENRAVIFEAIAPVRRLAVRLAPDSPPIRAELARASQLFRGQVAEVFAPELVGAADAGSLLDALDVATSWETWERLRVGQGLDVRAAAAAVTLTVTALGTGAPSRRRAE